MPAAAVAAAVVLATPPAPAAEVVAIRGLSHGRIVVFHPDDGARRVVARERYPSWPTWSPGHRRIAFAATLKAGFDFVSVVSRSGRHQRRVTGFGWSFPSWRADGRLTVACEPHVACDEDRSGLYVIDVAQPDEKHRIAGTSGASASAWAPRGKRLVFVDDRRGRGDLFVKRIGRPRIRRITHSGVDEAAPEWSPNGRWIVYSRPRRAPSQPHDLWLVSPEGDRSRRLTGAAASEVLPRWSRSGRRILFTTEYGLFSIRRDGTGRRRVRGSRRADCCADW